MSLVCKPPSQPDHKIGAARRRNLEVCKGEDMKTTTLQTPLQDWAYRLDRLQWSALILDGDWKLQWTSRPLRTFLRVGDEADLGYGMNLAEAWSSREEWLRTATPGSQIELVLELGPFLMKLGLHACGSTNGIHVPTQWRLIASQARPR